jgi:transposase
MACGPAWRRSGASSIGRISASKKTLYATEQHREAVAQARADWRAEQPRLDPRRLVFLDETGASTNLTRTHGRCPRGERLLGYAPHGHWKTTTFVSGLRLTGIVAPLVIDCPMNSMIFRLYVEQCLLPELNEGDIVILDNLSSHKAANVRALIEAKGAELRFLPPYSPDLNPIEQAIAKLKAHLRRAAERTLDTLWTRIGQIIDTVTPTEAANYLRDAGYEPN